MKGFKDSTKVQYMKGGSCDGYAKGGSVKGAAKISKVMGEFKRGDLHSGSKKGPEVTSKKQATAIALSEARKAGAKIPQPVQKKSLGGLMKEGISTRPTDKSGRRITLADLEKSNRDTGGMGKKAVEAAGRAIASGNRMAVEEGNESRLVTRKVAPRARVTSVEDKRSYGRAEPGAMLRRGPAGAGFGVEPLVNRMRDALGLKNGGLSTMPRGKK